MREWQQKTSEVMATNDQRERGCSCSCYIVVLLVVSASMAFLLYPPANIAFESSNSHFEGSPLVFKMNSTTSGHLSLDNLAFGIAGTLEFFSRRKELIKLWWRPGWMRGFLWFEEEPVVPGKWRTHLPPVKILEDGLRDSNPDGHPASLRIFQILIQTFRMQLPGIQWFVLCHDDTIFSVENLVRVLSKYNSSEHYYIGSFSESHAKNLQFSFRMAYSGGGVAFSYSLAQALVQTQGQCLRHYPELINSDEQLHICLSELGVTLTRESGFHQVDVLDSIQGFLSAHPIAPFVSLHHVDHVDPLFPDLDALEGLKLLFKAMETESSGFMQQAICYDRKQHLSFSISTGYLVHVFPEILYPRVLQKAEISFQAWDAMRDFELDARTSHYWPCKQPLRFFMDETHFGDGGDAVHTYYKQENLDNFRKICWSLFYLPERIHVVSHAINWYKVRRRQCCRIGALVDRVLNVTLGPCLPRESIVS